MVPQTPSMHFREKVTKTSQHREICLGIGKKRESIWGKKIKGKAEWKTELGFEREQAKREGLEAGDWRPGGMAVNGLEAEWCWGPGQDPTVMGGGGRAGYAAQNAPPKPRTRDTCSEFLYSSSVLFFSARLEKTESVSYHTIWAYPEGQSSEIHHISVS